MEVAVAFLVFFPFIFAVIDMSRYLVAQQELTVLATAAARYGMINNSTLGADCPVMNWTAGFSAYAPMLEPNRIGLSACSSNNGGLATVTVTATYNFDALTPGITGLFPAIVSNVTYQF